MCVCVCVYVCMCVCVCVCVSCQSCWWPFHNWHTTCPQVADDTTSEMVQTLHSEYFISKTLLSVNLTSNWHLLPMPPWWNTNQPDSEGNVAHTGLWKKWFNVLFCRQVGAMLLSIVFFSLTSYLWNPLLGPYNRLTACFSSSTISTFTHDRFL